MIVAVKVVGGDIHQHGDVSTEVVHAVQLERTEFNDVVVMFLSSYLQGQALADVTGQSHVKTGTLENVIDERSGCGLAIRSSDTNHLGISISTGELNFADDGCALLAQFDNKRSLLGDTGTLDHLAGIENQLLGMVPLLPGDAVAVKQLLIARFDD